MVPEEVVEKYDREMVRRTRQNLERFAEFMARMIEKYDPLPFHWQRTVFCLTVIEHPLIALQRCISLRYHTSCKESATPAEEIPELSAKQAER